MDMIKASARLSGCFARSLSLGGKEVLLKAVALALPVYAMSCFRLPKTTCKRLTKAMAAFWWNSFEHKSKIHWLGWDKLCLSKSQGSLGFKDLQCFNQALLAKQAWRLIQFPDCLFSRLFKSRYFPHNHLLQAVFGKNPSFAWRRLLHGRDLLAKGLRKTIGNGEDTSVWMVKWIFDGPMKTPLMKNPIVDLCLKVADLIDVQRRDWDMVTLQENFFPPDIDLIMAMKLVISKEDYWCWMHNKSGDYSVRYGYWLANQIKNGVLIMEADMQPSLNEIRRKVWEVKTNQKIKLFMWRALNGALSVADSLARRGMELDLRCQICGQEPETINHVLFSCHIARQLWALSDFPMPAGGFDQFSLFSNFFFLFNMEKTKGCPTEIRRKYPWILWYFWKNRNKFLFEGVEFVLTDTIGKIEEEMNLWFVAQEVSSRDVECQGVSAVQGRSKWKRPPFPWLKCNVGMSWSKRNGVVGCAWVLRNHNGDTILHSRRAFSGMRSADEARLKCLLWAIDSMSSHRIERVIFASDASELVKAVNKPIAWPSFCYQVSELKLKLEELSEWRVEYEDGVSNLGAFRIAQSVTLDNRSQSYVAQGHPIWLKELFDCEKNIA